MGSGPYIGLAGVPSSHFVALGQGPALHDVANGVILVRRIALVTDQEPKRSNGCKVPLPWPVVAEPGAETREMLNRGLAEVQALAEKAYWSAGKAYESFRGATLVTAGWIALLAYLVLRPAEGDPFFVLRTSLAAAVALALLVAVAVPVLRRLRRRFLPAINLAIGWGRSLWYARNPPPDRPRTDDPRSSFELLVEASSHIPEWRALVRGRGKFLGPGLAYVMYLLLLFGLFIFVGVYSSPYGSVAGVFVAVLLILGIPAYFVEAWRWEREFDRIRSEWTGRYAEVRARMADFVEGL